MRIAMCMFLMSLLAVGCGSSGSKKSHGPQAPHFELTEAEQRAFATWKQQVVKTCSATEAFEGKPSTVASAGIDLAVFYHKTSHSVVMKQDGNFVVFDRPFSMSGSGTSTLERSASVNDQQTENLSATTKQTGSHCEVFVSGKKVYETEIAASIPVLAFSDKQFKDISYNSDFTIQQNQSFNLAQVNAHGFIRAVSEAASKKGRIELVSRLLGISKEEATSFFPVSTDASITHAFRLQGLSVEPFSSNHRALYGRTSDLEALKEGSKGIELVYSIAPYDIGLGKIKNKADQGIFTIVYNMNLSPKTQYEVQYQINSVGLGEMKSYSDTETVACLTSRHSTLLKIAAFFDLFFPNFYTAVGPCEVHTLDMNKTLYQSEEARDLITSKFSGVSRSGFYNGWDEALIRLARYGIKQNANLASTLDPEARSPLIQNFTSDVERVLSLVRSSGPLKHEEEQFLNELAFSWAFNGTQVDDNFLGLIFKALANTWSDFPASSKRLLQDLGSSPEKQKETLEFAISINEHLKTLAHDLLKKGEVVGLRSLIEKDTLSSILQDKTSSKQLSNRIQVVEALTEFRQREEARVSDMEELSFQRKFETLAKRAFDEGWLSPVLTQVETIAMLARFKGVCENYTSVSSLIDCHEGDMFSIQDGKLLSPEYQGRYAGLAQSLNKVLSSMGDSDRFFLGSKLLSAFYEPVWASCTQQVFNDKHKTLNSQLNSWLKSDDSFERIEIQRAVDQTLSDCE